MCGFDCGPYQAASANRRLFPKASQEPLPEGDGQSSGELRGERKKKTQVWLTTCFVLTHTEKKTSSQVSSITGSCYFTDVTRKICSYIIVKKKKSYLHSQNSLALAKAHLTSRILQKQE